MDSYRAIYEPGHISYKIAGVSSKDSDQPAHKFIPTIVFAWTLLEVTDPKRLPADNDDSTCARSEVSDQLLICFTRRTCNLVENVYPGS